MTTPITRVGNDWTDINLPFQQTRTGAILQNQSDEVIEIRIGDDPAGFKLAPETDSSPGGSMVIVDHARGGIAQGPFQARCASGGKKLYARGL